MKLHNYFRSSTSFRARIALNLKGVGYDYVAYHLRHGEQRSERYLSVNPQGLVPALELDDGKVIPQSLAILEYLEEVHPEPPLLPKDPFKRALVRAASYSIACDIHPINNLRVLKYLADPLGHDEEEVATWFRHWVTTEFDSLEPRLAETAGRYCYGDSVTMADVCLIPQVTNNTRFKVDMTRYPTINKIFENCMALDAFGKAAPMTQPDAE